MLLNLMKLLSLSDPGKVKSVLHFFVAGIAGFAENTSTWVMMDFSPDSSER